MQIKAHRLEGANFTRAYYTGDEITPTIVVLHDTAGRLEKGNSAAFLASKNSGKVSVHFVVERDGTITQLVQTNHRANHAGESSFNGRQYCNGFSIGIEIVNPGRMSWASARIAKAWWGELFDGATYDVRDAETPEHGKGAWMAYTDAQIAAVTELLRALFAGIKSLTDITTHWYVSPGRKVDTNPLFPLAEVRAAVLGHDDPAAAEAIQSSVMVAPDRYMARVVTNGSALNLRSWPSFNPNVIGSIPNGTEVPVLRAGIFDGREWLLAIFDGKHGWISAAYTASPTPRT